MPVGYIVDKTQVDQISGRISRTIEEWAGEVANFETYLNATPDATLTAPPFSYTTDEVALLKSAIVDLSQLAQIYKGTAALAAAKDFGEFSRRLAGLVI
jgi:hypothetical protein